MRSIEDSMIIAKYDNLQECRKWSSEIPALHFEKEWDVKIIPPFGGAVIRFHINHNGKHVSVYFDGYSELGYMVDENDKPIPYSKVNYADWKVSPDGTDSRAYTQYNSANYIGTQHNELQG